MEEKIYAEKFYKLFTPIRNDIILEIPKNLEPFVNELDTRHNLNLQTKIIDSFVSQEKYESNLNKVIILYSSGIDSTWSLLYALENGYIPYPIFIEGLNTTVSYREKRAALEICDKLDIKLNQYKHKPALKKLHRDDLNSIETPESLVKLQYSLLLAEDLIKSEKIGSILITKDIELDDPDWHTPDEWFSDMDISMISFIPYLEDYFGTKLELIIPTLSKAEKIKRLVDQDLFELTSSCMSNPMFFETNRKRSGSAHKNMCGLCWKCKENLRFMKKI